MKHRILFLLFLFQTICCFSSQAQSSPFDTISIHFVIGKSQIPVTQRNILDSISKIIIRNDSRILIFGYADYLGTNSPNYSLSLERAKKVQQYLLRNGVQNEKILQIVGEGKIDIRGTEMVGNKSFRKVDIFIRNQNKNIQSTQNIDSFSYKMNHLAIGETMIVENIHFHYNSSKLIATNIPHLDNLAELMKTRPNMRIAIEGHVCCIDPPHDAWDEEYDDQNLSRNRAKSVRDYLIVKGIEEERLKYLGHGMRKPLIYPEKTAKDKESNRRVEIRLLKPSE